MLRESRGGSALSWKGFHGRKDSRRKVLTDILYEIKPAEQVHGIQGLGPLVEMDIPELGLWEGEEAIGKGKGEGGQTGEFERAGLQFCHFGGTVVSFIDREAQSASAVQKTRTVSSNPCRSTPSCRDPDIVAPAKLEFSPVSPVTPGQQSMSMADASSVLQPPDCVLVGSCPEQKFTSWCGIDLSRASCGIFAIGSLYGCTLSIFIHWARKARRGRR